jgi:dimethylhistidine N-methyltransferase
MLDTVRLEAQDLDAKDLHLDANAQFEADVLEGLSRPQKALAPKYFYDEAGSALFEAICRTPEYYPTRVETALLAEMASELAGHIKPGAALVEFGSGASEKTRLILDAAPNIAVYVPIDISVDALAAAAARIAATYPNLRVAPIAADFTLPHRQVALEGSPAVLGFFPGSTIGNFTPSEARQFLSDAHAGLGSQALFLIGVDLVKDLDVLRAAYNDAAGVTAAFNLNLLTRMNRELGADFQTDRFAHRAIWNADLSRIEMHLESVEAQTVRVADRTFRFRSGETLHTENSHKFTVPSFTALALSAGWRVHARWTSADQPFAEFLLAPADLRTELQQPPA